MDSLSSTEQSTCLYTGIGGVLLAVTCLIQLCVFIIDFHWVACLAIFVDCFTIAAYILLMLKRSLAPLLITICTALLLASVVIVIFSGLFSLIYILLFLYSVVITGILYGGGYYKKLMEDAIVRRRDRDEWKGKI